MIEAYKKDVDRTLIIENLKLTVDERLQQLAAMQRFAPGGATCRPSQPSGTDFEALLRALAGEGVEFIVIGGVAGKAHGSARYTVDLDVVYSPLAGQHHTPGGRPDPLGSLPAGSASRPSLPLRR